MLFKIPNKCFFRSSLIKLNVCTIKITINAVEIKITNSKFFFIIDLNFSREKYLNKAFLNSFEILMTKILLTRDLKKMSGIELNQIKKLVSSFQILDESYSKDIYKINIKILYNDIKVKKLLGQKNILFSQPENISAVFYPVLFVDGEIQNFNEIFFYKQWTKVVIENEIINFILPLEDLEDISKIIEMKNRIEELNIDTFIYQYNVENYVFALMDYQNKKLNIHLKINFNNNKINTNASYEIKSINDQIALNSIIKDLKLKITDLWKEENLINLLMPLSINYNFNTKILKIWMN